MYKQESACYSNVFFISVFKVIVCHCCFYCPQVARKLKIDAVIKADLTLNIAFRRSNTKGGVLLKSTEQGELLIKLWP